MSETKKRPSCALPEEVVHRLPCLLTLGAKPWWMSADQYDADGGPCRCLLAAGHEPPCVCEHTKGDDRG
jgi:hypothetical protein